MQVPLQTRLFVHAIRGAAADDPDEKRRVVRPVGGRRRQVEKWRSGQVQTSAFLASWPRDASTRVPLRRHILAFDFPHK